MSIKRGKRFTITYAPAERKKRVSGPTVLQIMCSGLCLYALLLLGLYYIKTSTQRWIAEDVCIPELLANDAEEFQGVEL